MKMNGMSINNVNEMNGRVFPPIPPNFGRNEKLSF